MRVAQRRVVQPVAGGLPQRGSASSHAPLTARGALHSPGSPLDPAVRNFFEPRFGHDFSRVRVHADREAGESVRALSALAYTVGEDIVVAPEQYRLETEGGRRLLAHELVHVVQQRGMSGFASEDPLAADRPDSPLEHEARSVAAEVLSAGPHPVGRNFQTSRRVASRADPQAVARTLNLRGIVGSGIQFMPSNITDTRVGPVTVPGGLLGDRASRLNVIIGENLTLRILARSILPLWTTATPFTPPGATSPLPLPVITEDELARALLVYNRYYLPVPSMVNWRAGLRFPLPVEIDESTGVATLHPLQIQALASGFDPAWDPLLDSGGQATAAPAAATLQADVAAFLAQNTTALGRGIHLGARALTNAVSALPFIREAFRQLGADALEVALNFMDFLVNREIGILAAQRDGAAILAEIRSALGTAPANPTTQQQERLTRATRMLDRVSGVAALAAPEAFVNPCDPIRPLTWPDFQGNPTGTHSAFTAFDFPTVAGPAGTRLRAVFNPQHSWVRPRFGNPTDQSLNGCDAQVQQCGTFFPPGTTGGQFSLTVPPGCAAAIRPNPSIVATAFSDCGGMIAAECARVAAAESARLLRHEQLHFDMACILVGKANAALAAGGPLATVRAALSARSAALTTQYDNQTQHGCVPDQQAAWESDVSSGLPNTHVP